MKKLSTKEKRTQELLAADAAVSLASPLLEISFPDELAVLFSVAAHPTESVLYLGLANGYVYAYRYKVVQGRPVVSLQLGTETAECSVMWRTRRHKGSVRCLALDADGDKLYSIGTDSVLKVADSKTGKVLQKCVISEGAGATKLVVTDKVVLVGMESGEVLVLSVGDLTQRNKITRIHEGDAINDIFHFAKRSMYKFVSLGQTTLAYWDCNMDDTREREKIRMSDDQEDEILCGAFVDDQVGDTLVCGMGEGILTVWKPEKNDLEDQMSRVKVCKNDSIDCIVPTLQDDNCVWCGCSDGKLYKVDAKRGKVVETRVHAIADECSFLDLDCEYHVVSGSMESVKVWGEPLEEEQEDSGNSENSDSFSDSSDSSDSSSEEFTGELTGLSREELIAELDKDIDVEPAETQEPKQKKQRRQKQGSSNNESHGITKFEGL
ncbi:Jip5p KNAG_0F03800 [Huiozyma naganishii CBS 8797]|uniref:Uncharacterized protein n=1 Tax=Huiozyma naganishii (strain ATCC MYA-139 / BCRC 22969 / CBS 8797 / KCTC 17520 / NBRC 10181 / NCYC 3082 / Yp74L-3) TaxID=1071383 RepID=J7S7M2_HUIN7|nr:hypothetical protein KNAG_0F03800 [Kazachstania naganishii CBS 8797]CCK71044.1 hypothetical protein KNAG_0F03800 [Kazachstania naganishii CBS 8797]